MTRIPFFRSSLIEEKYDDGGPCRHWRPGDADLGTWDIISSYASHGNWLETITEIEGSNSLQTAYQLERGANLTMMAQEAFPRGTPFEFSFECTYRERQPQPDPWHLFHLTNSHEESQLSVTLNPGKKTLQVSLPDASGDLQTVEFRHSAVSSTDLLLDGRRWCISTTRETRQFNEILIVMKIRFSSPLSASQNFL